MQLGEMSLVTQQSLPTASVDSLPSFFSLPPTLILPLLRLRTMPDSQPSSSSVMPAPSQRINTATRPTHTHLNALILTLLLPGLPPHVSTPVVNVEGISHILPIYEAFEGAFRLFLLRNGDEDKEKGIPLVEALRGLYMPELERVGRLRREIERILGANDHFSEERAQASRLDTFTTHMNTSIASKPHLLLAYTWLYMALFSGGRYIRAKLRHAGPGFWTDSGDEKGTDMDDYLSFWAFDEQEDGEDIKAEFKRKFARVEAYLTDKEYKDVIQVVGEIVETVGTMQTGLAIGQYGEIGGGEKSAVEVAEADEPSMRWLLLKHVLPMGMAELIAGASWAVTTGI